jgi:hypothetical protein
VILELAIRRPTVTESSGFRAEDAGRDQTRFVEPAAIRAAVARLDLRALARFEADWTAATARARDEYSLLPARYFVEHWFAWVAVARWPELATRLRDCERVVADSPDRAERRQAAIEISQILRQAETITA